MVDEKRTIGFPGPNNVVYIRQNIYKLTTPIRSSRRRVEKKGLQSILGLLLCPDQVSRLHATIYDLLLIEIVFVRVNVTSTTSS